MDFTAIKQLYSYLNGQYSMGMRKDGHFYAGRSAKRRSRNGMFKINQRAERKRSRVCKMKCAAR